MKIYGKIIILLIVIEIILSLFIASSTQGFACAPGSSCESVQNSIYGAIFGMKVAWFGAATFSILFLLYFIFSTISRYYWVFLVFTGIGFLFALYFIVLQLFVIKQICINCMVIDCIMIIIFIFSFMVFFSVRKEKKIGL